MHLSTVIKYMRRSPYQALSAALIMSLTFFVISVFSVLTILSIRMVDYFESRPQLTVFFNDGTEFKEIESLMQTLEKTGKTTKITYVSQEEALKIYKEQNKNDPILLDLVTADVLPASIEIQALEPMYLSDLAKTVTGIKIVNEVIYQKDIVDTLISWVKAFRVLGIAIIGVLVTVSLFVIVTIIGIKIAIRKDEIETMRLIGASNWFIRAPFLIEGMLYGMSGAFIGWSFCMILLLWSTPILSSFLHGIPIFPIEPLFLVEILGLQVGVASLLGMFASFVAVLRYLK